MPIPGFGGTAHGGGTQVGRVRGCGAIFRSRRPAAGGALRACSCIRARARRLHRRTFQRGYVLPDGALEQIPLGASQEQVLLVLGTPSTVATVSGEAFYYISQRADRPISFMPTEVTDQRVIAVYFDKDQKSAAARRIRPEGRQGFRLRQPHDTDRRQRPQHDHTIFHNLEGKRLVRPLVRERRYASSESCRRDEHTFRADRQLRVSAPAPRAAAAPRCW